MIDSKLISCVVDKFTKNKLNFQEWEDNRFNFFQVSTRDPATGLDKCDSDDIE